MDYLRRILLFAIALMCGITMSIYAAAPIKVLCIGNSFTVDAVQDYLAPVAQADGVDMVIGYPYKGGTTLQMHCNNIKKDTAIYNYRKIVNGKLVKAKAKTMEYAVKDEAWDYVVIQTDHNYSGVYSHYFPWLTDLMSYIKASLQKKDVKFLMYMTWAYDKDSNYKDYPLYAKNQDRMFSHIVDCSYRAAKEAGIERIIPGGIAVQNARTSSIGDKFTRDGYHMNLGYGRYLMACVWYEALTGRSIVGNSFRPANVSPWKVDICQHAAHLATAHPTTVSDMSAVWDVDPLVGYFKGTEPKKLRVGTTRSVFNNGLKGLNYKNFVKAKASGIDCIEISLTGLVNGDNPVPHKELKNAFRRIKADADSAGLEIWSIHMAYGADCDPSHVDNKIRKESIKKYKQHLDAVSVLNPKIILFHPSWRLGLNERPQRIAQLAKSMKELNKVVRKMNAHIVLENLLGYKLLRSPGVERPLGRTVEEMVEIMSKMPNDVYAAVDMNHIKHPELLIDALGSRIKSVHIADGDGEKELHRLPGRGDNDWTLILEALDRAGYTGPFLYEVKADQVEMMPELKHCYDGLYYQYLEYLRRKQEANN